jgi:hypothetical protein
MPPLPPLEVPPPHDHEPEREQWAEATRTRLLEGVGVAIDTRGILPGSLCVWGEKSTPVVLGGGPSVDDRRAVVGAAERADGSRVVAFAHEALLDGKTATDAAALRLVVNAAQWAAQQRSTQVRVAVIGRSAAWLHELIDRAPEAGWVAAGEWAPGVECDVVVWHGATGSADALVAGADGGALNRQASHALVLTYLIDVIVLVVRSQRGSERVVVVTSLIQSRCCVAVCAPNCQTLFVVRACGGAVTLLVVRGGGVVVRDLLEGLPRDSVVTLCAM